MDSSQRQDPSPPPIEIRPRKIAGKFKHLAVDPTPLGHAKDAPAPATEKYPCEYRIKKTLGSSTHGILMEAVHIKTGKYYTCKVINKTLVAKREFIVRNEIAALKRVSSGHKNIVTLYDHFESSTKVYLVFDLCSGGSLFDRISAKGNYHEPDAAKLVFTIMKAVEYIHDSDIVHRKLRPEDMLFRTPAEDADVMIADFSLSRVIKEEKYHLTDICGTLGYMAPEIFKLTGHGKPVDIWAIGVVTYFLLAGHTPFDREDQQQEMQAIIAGDYKFEPEYWANVTQTAKEFVTMCLTVDPMRRPTAKEALKHRWLADENPHYVLDPGGPTGAPADLHPYIQSRFCARMRFRRAVWCIIAIKRMSTLASLASPALPSDLIAPPLGGSRSVACKLRTVIFPRDCSNQFASIASINTARNRETCGLLLGKYKDRRYVVTTLLIPKQHAMGDTCAIVEEELVTQFTEERSLIILGWIHTHPTQSCFMSSMDLHKHSGFQRILPESFAVVCAPNSTPDFGIFRLTDPPGLQTIIKCQATEAFHLHPEESIYMDATKGHVRICDIPLAIEDLREHTALLHKPFALLSEDTLEFHKGSLSRFRHSEAGHIGKEEEEVTHASRTASERDDTISEPGTPKQRPATLPPSKTSTECGNVSHKLPSISDGDGLALPTDNTPSEAAANPTPEISEGLDMLHRTLQDRIGTPGSDRGRRYSCSDNASVRNEDGNYRKSFVESDNESYNVRCSVKTMSKGSFSSLRTVSSESSRVIGNAVQPREGVVSMEEAQIYSTVQPRIISIPEEDEDEGSDSDDSDRKSKMAFNYWGEDKVTLQKPLAKYRPGPGGTGSRRNPENSANAKFGNRFVSANSLSAAARRTSRRNVNAPSNNVRAREGVVSMEDYNVVQTREGVMSTEDIVHSRAQIHSAVQPRIIPMPEDDDDERSDSDDSDRKDKMSFSYWGADKVALQKPLAKDRPGPGGIGSRRNGPAIPSDSRESPANAKFGNRLVSVDSLSAAAHPTSRRNASTPSSNDVQPREGIVSMEDYNVVQTHDGVVSVEHEDEDEERDSDDSDRKAKMSFSYWGADKVTLQKPLAKDRPGPGGIRANAKSGYRLVSAESLSAAARPASRRNASTPSSNVVQPREGIVSMEDYHVVQTHDGIVSMEDEDEDEERDSDDSDRKAKMSFSYWGADKVTLQKPLAKDRPGGIGSRRNGPEPSANAKFGNRFVSADSLSAAALPASRQNVRTPSYNVVQSREGVVSMEDYNVVQTRDGIVSMEDEDEDEGRDSDDSDCKAKMSFSYWGADKVTLQKPLAKGRPGPGGIGSGWNGPESSANAKFSNRLVSTDSDSLSAEASPASRRNVNTPNHLYSRPGLPTVPVQYGLDGPIVRFRARTGKRLVNQLLVDGR